MEVEEAEDQWDYQELNVLGKSNDYSFDINEILNLFKRLKGIVQKVKDESIDALSKNVEDKISNLVTGKITIGVFGIKGAGKSTLINCIVANKEWLAQHKITAPYGKFPLLAGPGASKTPFPYRVMHSKDKPKVILVINVADGPAEIDIPPSSVRDRCRTASRDDQTIPRCSPSR